MKIGIFGGTFSPPHNTHVNVAKAAMQQLDLDKFVVMPCGDPPHKNSVVSAEHRLQMSRLAFGDFCQVSDYEVNAQGKSYTVQTLRMLKQKYPEAKLFLIIGGDSLKNFGKWYCPTEIASLATLVVASRGRQTGNATTRRIERDYGATVQFLRVLPTKTSSSVARLRYQFGLPNADVPIAVNNYVLANGLYANYSGVVAKVKTYLTEQRFLHTFYVVKRGLELATDAEKDKVFLACLLHDVAKYLPKSKHANYGYVQPSDVTDPVVHAFLGAEVAKKDFGIADEEILDAIRFHATGKPNMSRLAQIVYVADKTEDSRTFPKSHLKRGSLTNMLAKCLWEAYTVAQDRHKDSICALSRQAVEYYCPQAKNSQSSITQQTYGENSMSTNVTNQFVTNICKTLAEKSALDIKIVEIKGISDIADYFVICSARSAPQAKAIFENLEAKMEQQDKFALRKEGQSEGRWIAVDYGDVVVHIFHKDTRDVYALDKLWNNGANVTDYDE